MLADKTLLSVTLAATFASGVFTGFAAKGAGRGAVAPPTDPSVVYAPQLADLQSQGYDAAEMTEARQAYSDYLKKYQYWWNQFLDAHDATCRDIDDKLDKRLGALAAKHTERTGPK
jgi:hypothetical protein